MSFVVFLWFFPFSVFVVRVLKLFNEVFVAWPTLLGCLIFAAAGAFFSFWNFPDYEKHIERRVYAEKLVFTMSLPVVFWLIFILDRFGPPAFLYFLFGEKPPREILHGAYRAQLPLKAFWNAWVIALSFAVFGLGNRSFCGWAVKIWVLFLLVFYMGIYETRHVAIWAFLYLFFYFCLCLKDALAYLRRPVFLGSLIFLIGTFVFLGNLREGLTGRWHNALYFATGYAMNTDYAIFPKWVLWILLYLFSGTARGMVNAEQVEAFHFYIPPYFLPGVLQKWTLGEPLELVARFSKQKFAIDGWHSLLLCFGWVGGTFLLLAFLFLFYHVLRKSREVLERGERLPFWVPPFLLWACVRISLLFIGNYIFDFSGYIELFFLVVLFKILGVQYLPIRRA